jgi:addiction module RelE/StbE family toxin
MKVYWTEAAIADLRAIEAYISRHSPRYAEAMVSRIIDRTEHLPVHPLIGAAVAEYELESLREVLESPYRIVYRALPDRIDVVAVIHAARMLPPNLPREPERDA